MSESHKLIINNKIKINQYDLENNFIKEWQSAAAAARQFNKFSSGIANVLSGKVKTAHGFKWSYSTNILEEENQ